MFYLDLFRSLEQHRVRYLLVGGLAVNLYGVPRMTAAVDDLIALAARWFSIFRERRATSGICQID